MFWGAAGAAYLWSWRAGGPSPLRRTAPPIAAGLAATDPAAWLRP